MSTHFSFLDMVDLASERLGGTVLSASDDFFAEKENLIKFAEPVFIVDRYTEHGKWMDGWESRRKRVPGHDWCILRLGSPGEVHGVDVDTAFFTGNFPEYCSIEASSGDGRPDTLTWTEILPKVMLQGSSHNFFPIGDRNRWTHLRLNIFPDGGVARLRVYGRVLPDWKKFATKSGDLDLVAVENGGRALACSDRHYSHPNNLLLAPRAKTMGEGWETKRRRGPGFDWVVVRLGHTGRIKKIEVDTNHYKGNYPDTCSIEACKLSSPADLLPCDLRDRTDLQWKEIVPRTKLQPDHRHFFEDTLKERGEAFDLVRLNIFPDGGVSRLRVFGELV